MAGKQIRAAVVGASTLLGKELGEELNNSAAAAWHVSLLDEGNDSESQLSVAGDEPVLIQPLTAEALERMDVVFFAGAPEITREYWRGVAKGGSAIVDLSGALEGEPGFLVRCPWLPGAGRPNLETPGVVAAHPAALMLALVADRLAKLGLKGVVATVLEPASQAGSAGLDELHQQTVSLLSFQSLPKEIFDTQVAFNLQAELGDETRVDLPQVKETIRRHVRLLLAETEPSAIQFQVVQAPVFHGYTVSALVTLDRPATGDQVRSALNGGVIVAEDSTVPSNLAAAESGDVLVSAQSDRSRGADEQQWLWMAADNLRLSARGAVAAAMELAGLRPSERVQ